MNQKNQKQGRKQSLCWDCQRAAGKKMCTWALFEQPIPGWNAVERDVLNEMKTPEQKSFMVYDCPQFIEDLPRR